MHNLCTYELEGRQITKIICSFLFVGILSYRMCRSLLRILVHSKWKHHLTEYFPLKCLRYSNRAPLLFGVNLFFFLWLRKIIFSFVKSIWRITRNFLRRYQGGWNQTVFFLFITFAIKHLLITLRYTFIFFSLWPLIYFSGSFKYWLYYQAIYARRL